MKLEWSMGIADSEHCHLRPDGGCPIGDLQCLGASLRGDSDGQGGAPIELLGEVNDEPGLAGAWRRGNHDGGIARPGREQRSGQEWVGVMWRRGVWQRGR